MQPRGCRGLLRLWGCRGLRRLCRSGLGGASGGYRGGGRPRGGCGVVPASHGGYQENQQGSQNQYPRTKNSAMHHCSTLHASEWCFLTGLAGLCLGFPHARKMQAQHPRWFAHGMYQTPPRFVNIYKFCDVLHKLRSSAAETNSVMPPSGGLPEGPPTVDIRGAPDYTSMWLAQCALRGLTPTLCIGMLDARCPPRRPYVAEEYLG